MTELAEFDKARARLIDHPLYSQITTEDQLRIFMKHHVFEHGPLALRLLAAVCDGDPQREAEAEAVSIGAIKARIALWDGVLAEFEA